MPDDVHLTDEDVREIQQAVIESGSSVQNLGTDVLNRASHHNGRRPHMDPIAAARQPVQSGVASYLRDQPVIPLLIGVRDGFVTTPEQAAATLDLDARDARRALHRLRQIARE